ncbi:MAG: hypothetical protein K0Q76_654 [Panacagrimonas sp.]|jgi:hypothetical protein|nr:PA2779 family protein [Panacagrimonas sp.]MCC2655546.1 hypothetical protein [Panacagrimonas sp.]
MRNSLRTLLIGWLSVAMMLIGFPAHAGMIGTEQAAASHARAENLATVQNFIAREDVRAQLETWGVESSQATDRVAQLSDAELQQVAMNIDNQPAGGGALVIIGVVFVVLLILELVGVTNIFTSF